MSSESRLARIFIGTFVVTATAWSLAFVFSAIAGEVPFPKETLKKVGSHLDQDKHAVTESHVEELKGVEKISVEVGSADVTLIPSDDSSARIEFSGSISGDSPALIVTRDQSELSIKTRDDLQNHFHFSFFDNGIVSGSSLAVKVFIPKTFNKAVSVVTKSGDLTAQELTLANLSVKISSGDVKSNDCKIDQAEVKTSSGEIEFSHFHGALSTWASSGDIKINEYSGEGLRARTSSGDIVLADLQTDNVDVQATSGDVSVRVKEAKGWKFKLHATSGEIHNKLDDDPSGKRKMHINVTSGDISITQ